MLDGFFEGGQGEGKRGGALNEARRISSGRTKGYLMRIQLSKYTHGISGYCSTYFCRNKYGNMNVGGEVSTS